MLLLTEAESVSSDITIPANLEELTQIAQEKKGALSDFMEALPQKAFGLGVRVVLTLILLFVGRLIINFVRKLCVNSLKRANIDQGVIQFVDSFLSIILWVILVMSIAVNYGIDAASVVAILGSAGIAIGLSLQGALSNFAGGLLILMLKPFKIGDYIIENASGSEGVVTEINVFYTHLTTVDNRVVVVPNGKLADTSLVNVTRLEKRRFDLRVGISYDADIKKAKEVSLEVMKGCGYVLQGEPITVFVASLDDSAVTLGLRAWVNTGDYWQACWEINENIKLAFDENGIEIPFKQVDINMRTV